MNASMPIKADDEAHRAAATAAMEKCMMSVRPSRYEKVPLFM